MDNLELVVEERTASTKGAARELRRNGRIPAVLYGEGDPKAVSVDAKEWSVGFRHVSSNTIIALKVGKDEHNVLVKDIQDDLLSGRVNHIDFYAIHAGQKLQTQVPLHFEGNPAGVREGGILETKVEELDIICLPKDLPSVFNVDISNLAIGESLHVEDLDIPETVEVRTDMSVTVVTVTHAKAEVVETEGELEEGEEVAAEAAEEESAE